MKSKFVNWTEMHNIDLVVTPPHGEVPALGTFQIYTGPLSLHFGMKPDQMRDLALLLNRAADAAEKMQVEA